MHLKLSSGREIDIFINHKPVTVGHKRKVVRRATFVTLKFNEGTIEEHSECSTKDNFCKREGRFLVALRLNQILKLGPATFDLNLNRKERSEIFLTICPKRKKKHDKKRGAATQGANQHQESSSTA